MILPATSTVSKAKSGNDPESNISDDEEDEYYAESGFDEPVEDDDSESELYGVTPMENNTDFEFSKSTDPNQRALSMLRKAWKSFSPPVKETEIIGKWYGVIYRATKKTAALYVTKVLQRILQDEDGPV